MTVLHHNRGTSHWLVRSPLNWLRVIAVVAAISILGFFHDCFASGQRSQGIVGAEQQSVIRSSLAGEWISDAGDKKIALRFTPEGGFSLGTQEGHYVPDANTVILKTDTSEASYQFQLAGNELTLSGDDLKQPLKFTRIRGLGDYEDWLSYLSPKSLLPRLKRIAVIAVIAVSCRVLLLILQVIIHFVIYCDWGPLKFVFARHKNRTMTMYSLLINLSKYVVYLAALGFGLTELGINYTAYLASLSVVGLAIGFGSQGLVQDMVTGFFIVFEEQFNVGDMVEIPPHVGIVQELGLRMTRLRNYLGQKVVIPNRNIATVGNYTKGAQQVNIDVAAASLETAAQMRSCLAKIVEEIGRQFGEVVLATSETSETISLSTDEHFARLSMAIWPQQQWVIEQEVVPRMRSALQKKGFEIPNDKVSVFYHPREQQSVGVRNRSKNDSRLIQPKRRKRPGSAG
ncbi:MAG: mechanosensitive ion channel [Phycisphaerae bacterium]|nr:mechanosensitive ion channel [Phycisphaerae bacterium]